MYLIKEGLTQIFRGSICSIIELRVLHFLAYGLLIL